MEPRSVWVRYKTHNVKCSYVIMIRASSLVHCIFQMTMSVIPQESVVSTALTPKARLNVPVIQAMNLSIKPLVLQIEVSRENYFFTVF